MPSVAREHTAAGAKAFVVYYWHVVDYAQKTLDTTLLQSISNKDCLGCNNGIVGLRHDAKRGARIRGGDNTVSNLRVTPHSLGEISFTQALLSVTNTTQTETFPNGKVKHTASATVRLRMLLQPIPAGWSVETLEPAP